MTKRSEYYTYAYSFKKICMRSVYKIFNYGTLAYTIGKFYVYDMYLYKIKCVPYSVTFLTDNKNRVINKNRVKNKIRPINKNRVIKKIRVF